MDSVCVDCGVGTKGCGERCYSCASKKVWADPECRKSTLNAIRSLAARLKASEKTLVQFADPEKRKRHSDAMADPIVRRKILDAWADPEHKKMHSEAIRLSLADPAVKKKQSKVMRARWRRGDFDCIAYRSPSKLELSVLDALETQGLKCDGQYRPEGCSYVYDILMVEYNTLIEIDGDYWHSLPGVKERDVKKDEWAVSNSYGIIRVPECAVRGEGLEEVVRQVIDMLEESDG